MTQTSSTAQVTHRPHVLHLESGFIAECGCGWSADEVWPHRHQADRDGELHMFAAPAGHIQTKHSGTVIETQQGYRAECGCGWSAPEAWDTKIRAEHDALIHEALFDVHPQEVTE